MIPEHPLALPQWGLEEPKEQFFSSSFLLKFALLERLADTVCVTVHMCVLSLALRLAGANGTFANKRSSDLYKVHGGGQQDASAIGTCSQA